MLVTILKLCTINGPSLPAMRICVVTSGPLRETETFIRQHVTNLPSETILMDNWPPWTISSPSSRWKATLAGRAYFRALGWLPPEAFQQQITSAYISHLWAIISGSAPETFRRTLL
jgi:hypothetical protein